MANDELEASAMMDNLLDRVRGRAGEHPLAAIGIAGAVGYVLGGGLPRLGVMLALAAVGGIVGFGLPAMIRDR